MLKEDIQFHIIFLLRKLFQDRRLRSSLPFVISFIQSGKEAHTSSMVQSLTYPFLSPISFQALLDSWDKISGPMEEIAEIALSQFFHHLRIKTHSVLFLIVDDTVTQKTGKKMPAAPGIKREHTNPMSLATSGSLFALLYKDFLLPLWAHLYHPKGTKGCGPFRTKNPPGSKRCSGSFASRSL